jgi:hypothetical protein
VFNPNDDERLKRALESIPVPTPGDGFNARILEDLARPRVTLRNIWPAIQPMARAAACTFAASLLLLRWATQPASIAAPTVHPVETRADAPALSLDNVDLTRLSLLEVETMARRPAAPRPERGNPPADPDLHSELKRNPEGALA